MISDITISHHGAVDGVTGSCHRLTLPGGDAVLIDCGLFQGAETSGDGASERRLNINFDISTVRALLVTHVHIDHVGRIPYLLAAGYKGPIFCSEASAELLPMVLEDALKVGFTRDADLTQRVMAQLKRQIVPVPYGGWLSLFKAPSHQPGGAQLRMRFQPAGHILGSAYLELEVARPKAFTHAAANAPAYAAAETAGVAHGAAAHAPGEDTVRVVFSGDLGPPETPLLPDVKSPERADVVVIESTYGDRLHESRLTRRQRLQSICERALANGGTVLIPAFSIGRTQELLYELEDIIHEHKQRAAAPGLRWGDLHVVVDSPLAADFTAGYSRLKTFWDDEARARLKAGRHPLDFKGLLTVDSHENHLRLVNHLAKTAQPAIVIAASGMCSGGRIVNYLKAMLGDARHDVLFCGYQAAGTPGREIQAQGPKDGTVLLAGERLTIRAAVHTLGGFSAHADQADLLRFLAGIPVPPHEVRIVHGEDAAKRHLAEKVKQAGLAANVVIP